MEVRSKINPDLLFENVELHSLGKREHGSLLLSKHHFVFRYLQSAKAGEKTSHLDSGTKPRTSELWFAYPLINYCVLRPSHSAVQPVRYHVNETQASAAGEDGELFPPTYGTSDYGRPSTDSARLASFNSSPRPASPVPQQSKDVATSVDSGRQPVIRLRLKDFRMMALHFQSNNQDTPADNVAREVFYTLRDRSCVDNIKDLHAFHFNPPKEELAVGLIEYDTRREYARMGISSKAADGAGSAWRVSEINKDYSYSDTYPSALGVPRAVSDNLLKYGGVFRSRSRIPCLSYLHSNGGSITRSSQPMAGVQNRRNPQDERLVSAIFCTHTAPSQPLGNSPAPFKSDKSDPASIGSEIPDIPISQSDTALDENPENRPSPARKKVYGSTRRNLIVDARPKLNALMNRATGGGIEDIANYQGDMSVEKVFLNIANIHVMRASLEKVVESFANSDYIQMKPDQEALRKSGWLGHIAGMLDGTEMIARVIGLGGSHVLVHCSDGWDRTAQVSALAQIMLDPHSRTLSGFISLVQKEFLSFGHKFRDRNGIEGCDRWFEIENERVMPPPNRSTNNLDPSSLNTLGAKAFSGAKNWFEKSRGNLFRQQNGSQDSVSEKVPSRPPSPPPNSLVHSSPSSSGKEDKRPGMSEKEVAPIFHQFLDGVYQMLYQNPNAFEFNERFLRRLFYHSYSCQYGEFLFNNERERTQNQSKVGSVWSHFLSRRKEFVNPDYVAKVDDPLLFPNRRGIDREVDVRWWHGLFGRTDEEMNVPRALARTDPAPTVVSLAPSLSFDERVSGVNGNANSTAVSHGNIKETQSVPNLSALTQDLPNPMSSVQLDRSEAKSEVAVSGSPTPVVSGNLSQPTFEESDTVEVTPEVAKKTEYVAPEYDGDPLGVMASMSKNVEPAPRLDFAAFASQNAFRER